LGRMRGIMAGHVESGHLPGLVALVSRHGEVHVDVIGKMAIGGASMRRDTIFRITSMTKPVTAAAAMILVEECKLRLDDPVERWLYNSGTEILGVLIARAAGTTFGKFLHERIFAPLGMNDTGFSVPAAKLDRFATAYTRDHATGELKVFDDPSTGKFAKPPLFENGSAGLVSTADDFNAFAQMMQNG